MKNGIVTYGGYLLAACLLVAMAVSQQSGQDQASDNPFDDKPAFKLLKMKARAMEIAQLAKGGEVDLSSYDYFGLGEDYAPDSVYSEIAATHEALSDFIALNFTISMVYEVFNDDPEGLAALRAGEMIDSQRVQLAQNQRIIELLEGLNEQ